MSSLSQQLSTSAGMTCFWFVSRLRGATPMCKKPVRATHLFTIGFGGFNAQPFRHRFVCVCAQLHQVIGQDFILGYNWRIGNQMNKARVRVCKPVHPKQSLDCLTVRLNSHCSYNDLV